MLRTICPARRWTRLIVVRGTERLPVARKSAALMSLSSGTNSPGFGIREIEVFVMTALLHIGSSPFGGFTALTNGLDEM
ncbi:hypothetical protein GCM10010347_20700 [Streptomyces cirratus]|uniref:Uncharacterized protein n=1 Tax=Streptomyces cirratus TaxID=68187 RepID=A0ABQ3EPZ1_9ACTN|nr:hypothetical protein GCM10010347_20700 [Streptomyces cirratus]